MSNTNTSNNVAASTALVKDYYDRKLLERAKSVFVYAQFGQKRIIPANSGKTVEFRRWELFTANTETLKLPEGVTPNGQSLSQSTVRATVDQYGAYVEVSDMLDLIAADPVIRDCVELLGEQLGTVVDWVTRDAMIAGASAQYSGGRASKLAITASDKLTVTEIRKAVRTLKITKARKFSDGRSPHFVCVCDPYVTYDIQSDTLWQDVSKYNKAEQIYSGELGRLFGVVFVETTEGFISKQSVLTAVSSHSANSADVIVDDLTNDAVKYLVSGAKIKIGTTEYTVASCDKAAKKITLDAAVASQIAADTIVYSEDAGACDATTKAAIEVHHTLMFGADAYGIIDIAGSGTIQSIVKPVGSGNDPLNQRSTVGAKVMGYTAKVLNSLWIIDIMSAVSD